MSRQLNGGEPILTSGQKIAANRRLKQAVRRNRTFSTQGLLELLFTLAFKGLVYPQIWEDPEVDLEALAITPDCHVATIASGGCNVLSYLIADPAHITAVDLIRAHVALNRLKLAAVRHLPTWQSFYRFFGEADTDANVAAYWRVLAPALDAETRGYWEGRNLWGRRRVTMFSRNVYRCGLLGHAIGLGHLLARLHGVDLREMLRARSIAEQRAFFETSLAPLFDKPLVRWATGQQMLLYGFGIPPAQYAALGAGAPHIATVLRDRVERLSCDFSLDDNYFAWQAFGRSYPNHAGGPLPPYLKRTHFETIRARADRVEVLNRSFTEYLRTQPDRSLDRYVLLDAQDWMSDQQLNELWREITRTARDGARAIFRTAAEPSPLPGRVDDLLLGQWHYKAEQSRDLARRDRSAIYGGFHLYVLANEGRCR
jgi:S-adenosylmethionine-diacylglycerol 3-amino-3-carboxypropyl transferase